MPEVNKKNRPSPEQLAAARALLGHMTQAELAQAAGVSVDTISLFESGTTRPYDSTLEKIETALERRGITFTNGDKPSVTLDRSKAVIPS